MVLKKAAYALDHCPLYGIVIRIAKIHSFRDQWVVSIIISSDQLETFGLYSCRFMFFWPRSLSSKWESASSKSYNKHSIELEAKISSWLLWLPMSLSQHAKKGTAGLIVADYQGEVATSSKYFIPPNPTMIIMD